MTKRWIALRAEPLTQRARRANDRRRQVLASNIDTALLVMGLDRNFNIRRLERYIAVVQSADIAPVVVLTKADIADDVDDKILSVQQRLPANIAVVAVNGTSDTAKALLQPWLQAGQTIFLLGASGTGKSTLTKIYWHWLRKTRGIPAKVMAAGNTPRRPTRRTAVKWCVHDRYTGITHMARWRG